MLCPMLKSSTDEATPVLMNVKHNGWMYPVQVKYFLTSW